MGEWVGRGEVRGLQGCHCRHVTGRIGLGEAEQLGVAQRRAQRDGEVATGIDGGAADFLACRVGHGHLRAHFAAAGEGDTITGNRQFAWCRWRGGIGGGDGAGGRLVASRIAQHYLHLLAVGLRRCEVDLEGAVGAHRGTAQHRTIGGEHPHGGTRFAGTVQQAATPGEGQVVGRIRRDAVRGCQADAVGLVAGHIGLAGAELFAVNLRGAQVDVEGAIGIDHGSAQVDTAFAKHGNGGTCFTAATEYQAVVGQHQVGQWLRCRGVRCL